MRKHTIKVLAIASLLALGGVAMTTSAQVIPIPGPVEQSVVYYDDDGNVVGVRMSNCGNPGWGEVTLRSRSYDGCIM